MNKDPTIKTPILLQQSNALPFISTDMFVYRQTGLQYKWQQFQHMIAVIITA